MYKMSSTYMYGFILIIDVYFVNLSLNLDIGEISQ